MRSSLFPPRVSSLVAPALLAAFPATAQVVYPGWSIGNDYVTQSGATASGTPYTLSDGSTVTVNNTTYVSHTLAGGASLAITSGHLNTNALYVGYNTGTGTVSLDGSGSTLAVTSYQFNIGYQRTGTLTLANGATATGGNSLYLGYTSTGHGTVNLSGTDTRLTLSSSVTVGSSGTGAINASAGAQLVTGSTYLGFSAGSNGAVTLTGAGTTYSYGTGSFDVGMRGAGTLSILDGAKLQGGNLYVARESTATGSVLVSGTGSSLSVGTNTLSVATAGTGSLTLAAGATVTAGYFHLAQGAGTTGTMTLTGAGTSFTNTRYTYLGDSGAATLRVENGASYAENGNSAGYGYFYVGYNPGSSGSIVVTGAGSTFSASNNFYLGYAGAGSLLVENGATASLPSLRTATNGGTAAVTVTGANSVLNVTPSFGWGFGYSSPTVINVTHGGRLNAPGGTGINGAGVLNLESGGTLGGSVSMSGGTFNIGAGSSYTAGLLLTRGNPTENVINVLSGGTLGGSISSQSVVGGPNNFNRLNLLSGATYSGNLTAPSMLVLRGGGTITGNLAANSGSRIQPGDTFGRLRVNGNSTLAGGSIFTFDFRDANDGAGLGWDTLSTGGTLRFNGTSSNRITLNIQTVGLDGLPGLMSDFNPAQNYSWSLFTDATTLTFGTGGSVLNSFTLNLGGFANSYNGTFALARVGNNLALNYTTSAIPEPSTYATLAALAALGFASLRRRRRA